MVSIVRVLSPLYIYIVYTVYELHVYSWHWFVNGIMGTHISGES